MLQGLRTASDLLKKVEVFVLAYGIIALALIAIVNVFCRNVLQTSLSFAEEASQILIIWITFLGTSYAAREGRHIRMSALYDQLSIPNKKRLRVFTGAVTSLMMFVLAYYSVMYILAVRQIGMNSPALDIPFAWIYIAAPIGLTMAGIQYALMALRNLVEEGVYISGDYQEQPLGLEAEAAQAEESAP